MFDFDKVILEQLKHCEEVLLTKQKEYATEDKLHNFRTAAELQQITMEQALAGMMCKHTVSIYDMIASGDIYDIEKWDEKITDNMVYLLLLKAIIEEHKFIDSKIAMREIFEPPKFVYDHSAEKNKRCIRLTPEDLPCSFQMDWTLGGDIND